MPFEEEKMLDMQEGDTFWDESEKTLRSVMLHNYQTEKLVTEPRNMQEVLLLENEQETQLYVSVRWEDFQLG